MMESSPQASKQIKTQAPVLSNVAVGDCVGCGRRARVYEARYLGRRAVVKVYSESQKMRCKKYLDQSAAEFEYARNTQFYENENLRPYSAEPLDKLTTADGDEVFVQEYIDAPSVAKFVGDLGYLPTQLFETARAVIEESERIGMDDLDTPANNVKVVDDGHGVKPVFFDFNLIPQRIAPPNPIVALLYRTGVRKPAHRDYRGLTRWLKLGLLRP